MPIIESSFVPARIVRGHRVQTIAPALLRVSRVPERLRERLELSDGDFLDIDSAYTGALGAAYSGASRAVIISHGLEGSSDSGYVRGISARLYQQGYDVFAWNMRGCSGELNRQVRSYHSGFTDDLAAVIHKVAESGRYSSLSLVGFSVGGNITLKYLGEQPENISPLIHAAVAFSVPADLTSSAAQLARSDNAVYMRVFLKSLFRKLRMKEKRSPGSIDLRNLDKIKTFSEYDARFIAPLFGFASAEDYWKRASSLPFLHGIRVPTLLISSRDDSFIASPSIPLEIARQSSALHLEVPRYGGHVGFMRNHPWGSYYSDDRALEFLERNR